MLQFGRHYGQVVSIQLVTLDSRFCFMLTVSQGDQKPCDQKTASAG